LQSGGFRVITKKHKGVVYHEEDLFAAFDARPASVRLRYAGDEAVTDEKMGFIGVNLDG